MITQLSVCMRIGAFSFSVKFGVGCEHVDGGKSSLGSRTCFLSSALRLGVWSKSRIL